MDKTIETRKELEERLDGMPMLFPFEGGIVELGLPQDYSLMTEIYAVASQ